MDLLAQLAAVQGEAFFPIQTTLIRQRDNKDGPGGAIGGSI
jgi:hypothetical protein